jgi:hypothetical protein
MPEHLDIENLDLYVEELIEEGAEIVYDVAAEHCQQVANVAHMRWFHEAVKEAVLEDNL